MPTAAQLKEQKIALQARYDEEYEHILTTLRIALAGTGNTLPGVIAAVLDACAASFSAEAASITAAKRKGHVTDSRDYLNVALRVRGLATQIEGYGARNAAAWGPFTLSGDWLSPLQAEGEHRAQVVASGTVAVTAPVATIAIDEAERAEAVRRHGQTDPGGPLGPDEPAASGHYAPGTEPTHLLPPSAIDAQLDEMIPLVITNGDTIPAGTLSVGQPIFVRPTIDPNGLPDIDMVIEALTAPWTPPEPPTPSALPADLVNPFAAPKAPGRVVERPTFAQVGALLGQLGNYEGSSFSQIAAVRSCDMQHALKRLSRSAMLGAERPGWEGVGGTALHTAIGRYEDWYTEPAHLSPDGGGEMFAPTDDDVAEMWLTAFEATISEQLATAGPYQDLASWHASARGKEGYDWWRVEGLTMLRRYITSHDSAWGERFILLAQEFEYRFDVDGIESHGYVDQVWEESATGLLTIQDLKSGAREQSDPLQLGEYGWALVKVKGIEPERIASAVYWNARTGERREFSKILQTVTWDELAYWHHATRARKQLLMPLPNVSTFCGGCGVRDLCPAQG